MVLQRVKEASVRVDDMVIASIGMGLLLLVGIEKGDTEMIAERIAGKIVRLRVFADLNGKMNLDIRQVAGEVLSVSQFTLAGDISKGNRPGFDNAGTPQEAERLWRRFNDVLVNIGIAVGLGKFGAHMEVGLVGDGPVTFIVNS